MGNLNNGTGNFWFRFACTRASEIVDKIKSVSSQSRLSTASRFFNAKKQTKLARSASARGRGAGSKRWRPVSRRSHRALIDRKTRKNRGLWTVYSQSDLALFLAGLREPRDMAINVSGTWEQKENKTGKMGTKAFSME